MSIPKILLQTVDSKEHIPAEIYGNVADIRELNPDRQYRLYDDDRRKKFILAKTARPQYSLLKEPVILD
jgi:mannosyltransferase OCH1-like enzyme